MRHWGSLFLLVTVAGSARCAGTETDNPSTSFVSFEGESCHRHARPEPAPGGVDAGLGTGRQTSALANGSYDGLNCVAWNREQDGTLQVDVWNFKSGCGLEWSGGSARIEGDAVYLAGHFPRCLFSSCGNCIYDAHFRVQGTPDTATLDLYFDVTDDDGTLCQEKQEPTKLVTVPVGAKPSGAVCRPADTGGVSAIPLSCVRHARCGDPYCTGCAGGDTCAPISADGAKMCLAPCSADADCPNPSMACQDGACVIASTW